jgi:hypothetical protein
MHANDDPSHKQVVHFDGNVGGGNKGWWIESMADQPGTQGSPQPQQQQQKQKQRHGRADGASS